MKFLVPNYSCLQIRGLPLLDPRSLCPLSSSEFVEPPRHRTEFLGTPLEVHLRKSAATNNYGRPADITATSVVPRGILGF